MDADTLEFVETFKRQYSSSAEAHGRFLNFKAKQVQGLPWYLPHHGTMIPW